MDSIRPVSYKILIGIFEAYGCNYSHTKGDHIIFHYQNATRPVVIPMYKEVPIFIIKNNMRVVGMSNEDYFRLLKKVR